MFWLRGVLTSHYLAILVWLSLMTHRMVLLWPGWLTGQDWTDTALLSLSRARGRPVSAHQPSLRARLPANFSCHSLAHCSGPAWQGLLSSDFLINKFDISQYSQAANIVNIHSANNHISGNKTFPLNHELCQNCRKYEVKYDVCRGGKLYWRVFSLSSNYPGQSAKHDQRYFSSEIKQNWGIKPIKYNQAGQLSLLSQRWKMKD